MQKLLQYLQVWLKWGFGFDVAWLRMWNDVECAPYKGPSKASCKLQERARERKGDWKKRLSAQLEDLQAHRQMVAVKGVNG